MDGMVGRVDKTETLLIGFNKMVFDHICLTK